jgi:hypothetical protein
MGCVPGLEDEIREVLFEQARDILETLYNAPDVPVPHDHPHPGERPAGSRGRDILTDFGRVRVDKRSYYHNAQTQTGRLPFDDALGLLHGATPAFAQRAMRAAASESYAAAAENLRREGLREATPDVLKGLCRALAPAAARFMREPPAQEARADVACVVTQVDGTTAPMRPEALQGVKGRAPDGVARGREVKLAVQFEALPAPGQKPRRVEGSKRIVATLEKKEAFGGLAFANHQRAYPTPPALHLFMGDGAPWVWDIRATHFPDAVEILDFYHAALHLEPLLDLWGVDAAGRTALRGEWRAMLKAGKVDALVDLCAARGSGLDSDRVLAWEKALGYYRTNRGRMRYDEYISKGWPIGSGEVEGACKSVVCDRFKCSGMLWSSEGLEALLPFRAALKAGCFEKLWKFILEERQNAVAA